jgi:hypothetical protein
MNARAPAILIPARLAREYGAYIWIEKLGLREGF